jgi:hypothetical protein
VESDIGRNQMDLMLRGSFPKLEDVIVGLKPSLIEKKRGK